jgi:hypothetical protein
MGPLVSHLLQLVLLAAVLALGLAAGWALARALGNRTAVALSVGLAATVLLGSAVWLLADEGFRRLETDHAAVATLVTTVLGVLWLAGLATGYALRRLRS